MSQLSSSLSDQRRAEAAADWVLRIHARDLDDADVAKWLDWCEADPRNRAAFEAMVDLWETTGDLDVTTFANREARAANDEGVTSFGGRRVAFSALAAIVIALIAGTLLLRQMRLEQPSAAIEVARFETPLGQVRRTTLVDGSHVVLGGRSALSVRYSRNRRIVVAERGEAFFRVAHNPDRPFVVEAGPVTVTAIGTAFSVQRDGDTIGVVVSEGVVEVQARPHPGSNGHTGMPATLRVAAGQRVRFDRGEITQTIEPAAFDLVTPWREGRLEFRDEPLRLIVARINRYSPRQLEISDPSIADLRLTTTVYRGRVDAWLDGLVTVLPVRVTEKDNDHAVISPAN